MILTQLMIIWFLVFFAFDIHTYYDGAVVNLDKELYSKHCSILANNEIFSLISEVVISSTPDIFENKF